MKYLAIGLFWTIGAWAAPDSARAQATDSDISGYQEQPITESVSVHLSETVIGAGEPLWFQAIVSDTDSAARLSEVVYLELMSQTASVAQGIYRAPEGIAAGQLLVPDTLTSGWYELRTYTQYQRNGSPSQFSAQSVLVVNPNKAPSIAEARAEQPEAEAVSFFPEGGKLVGGVENRVIVRLNSKAVSPPETRLDIIQAVDSGIVAGVSFVKNIGAFAITPEAGVRYRGRLLSSQDTTYVDLPEVSPSGYAMRVMVDRQSLRITGAGRSEGGQLLVRNRQQLLYRQQLDSDSFSTSVSTSEAPGLVEVAILSEQGNEATKRLVYVPSNAIEIPIDLDQNSVGPRQKITFSLKPEDLPSERAILSVSVRKLVLSSLTRELGTAPEGFELAGSSQHEILAALNSQPQEWVNDWLVTQRPFWPELGPETIAEKRYVREDEVMLVTGTVTTRQPAGEEDQVLLSIPGDDPYFEYSEIGSDGSFAVPVSSSQGSHSVVLQYDSPANATAPQEVQWELNSSFTDALPPTIPESFPLTEKVWLPLVEDYRLRDRIYAVYRDDSDEETDTTRAPKKQFRFYGAPNFQVNPDDYIALPSFEEICRELLPGVRLKEKRGVYDFDIFNPATRDFLENEPTIFLDGVPVRNISYIVNLPPDQIESIETVNRRTYYGSFRLDGVVAVYTKQGKAYEEALSSVMKEADIRLYTQSLPFSAPDSLSGTAPDFRTLLYWQPKVTITPGESKSISLATADELGEFEIVLEGVTEEGQPVYGRTTFEVIAPRGN